MGELLDFTKPHVLRNETEYAAAVEEVDRLLDSDPPKASEEHERLEFLSVLIEAYEDAHHPLEDLTTPQDAVVLMLEQQGRSQGDLASWLGGELRAAEFLAGRRALSLEQIDVLRDQLGIPADLLMQRSRASLSA
jgi:HTH-type transcriptional regulator/antitoxin HigA